MKEWWGPKGSTVVASKMDFRVGGTYLGAMRDPAGNVMWAKFVYREIVAPERLVWEHSFSDEAGGLTRHPLSPTWPLKLLTTVTFDEPLKGQTGLTLRWSPLEATAEEQKTFDAAHDGMRGGWGGTFERLTAYLADAKCGSQISGTRTWRRSNRRSALACGSTPRPKTRRNSTRRCSRIPRSSRSAATARPAGTCTARSLARSWSSSSRSKARLSLRSTAARISNSTRRYRSR